MGWNRFGIQFERNTTYKSILRNIALSLRFARTTGGGYDFIKNAFDSDGIYMQMFITINKRNPANNKYEFYYSGILDTNPDRFIIERNFIEAPILDNSKLQKFKSRDELEINLFATESIDGVALTPFSKNWYVNLTPIDIVLDNDYGCDNVNDITYTANVKWTYFNNKTVYLNQIGERFDINGDALIYTNTTENAVKIKFTIQGDVGWYLIPLDYDRISNPSIKHIISLYTDAGVLVNDYEAYAAAYTTDIDEISISTSYSYTVEIDVLQNYYIELGTRIGHSDGLRLRFFQNDSLRMLVYETTEGKETTTTKCLFPFEAFTRALQILTSETDTTKILDAEIFGRTDSEFTTYAENGEACYDAIFSGNMCRNYPDTPLNIKFKDLFQHFAAIYNLGMGYDNVNDRFYIKPLSAFYDKDYFMFDLGEVSNLKITPFSEGYFNKIMAGCDDNGNYEELQGAYEFQVKREYSMTPPVKEDKDVEAKYKLGSVPIELARKKQYVDNASLDTREDNSIFTVRTDGADPVLDATVTGFPGIEKYYNTMLSPRQNLLRHGNILHACSYKSTADIKLQKSDKKINMIVGGVDESTDIAISELNDPLFVPLKYEFTSYVLSNIINIMLNNPHGYVKFSNFGVEYEGYMLKPETGDYNRTATYQLIAKEQVDERSKIFEDGKNFIFEDGKNYIFED